MATRISKLEPKELASKLMLKVLRIDTRLNGHKFVTVVDKDKTSTTLIFWERDALAADGLVLNKWHIFEGLLAKEKFSAKGKSVVDLQFTQGTKIDGKEFEVEGPKGIAITGSGEFEDGEPRLKALKTTKLAARAMVFVESDVIMQDKVPSNYTIMIEPSLPLIEKQLIVPNIHIPNKPGSIIVPIMNLGGAAEIPEKCPLGILKLQVKPKMKFVMSEIESLDDTFSTTDEEDSATPSSDEEPPKRKLRESDNESVSGEPEDTQILPKPLMKKRKVNKSNEGRKK